MAARINQAERDLNKARSEGAAFREMARALRPGATEEQINQDARALAGISSSNNIEIRKVGDTIVGFNSSTGEQVLEKVIRTPEEKARQAALVKRAEILASKEAINELVGKTPELEHIEKEGLPPTVADPNPVSADFRRAQELLHWGAKLAEIPGQSETARAHLQAARDLLEFSPDAASDAWKQRELSPEAAQDLGVAIGSTYGDVIGRIPPSGAEKTFRRTVATERGKAAVKAESKIGFIREARTVIIKLMEAVQDDERPLLGLVGSVRKAGQTFTQIMTDLGIPELANTALSLFDQAEGANGAPLGPEERNEFFNAKELSQMELIQNSVGFILARLEVDADRIPVDVIRKSIESLNLMGVTGEEAAQDRLGFVLEKLNRRENTLSEVFERGFSVEGREKEQEEDTVGMPRFRIVNGVLVPVEEGTE
jgi:class 3 adenylate cyclase